MKGHTVGAARGRRRAGVVKKTFFTLGALVLFLWDELRADTALIWVNGRLFAGLAFVGIGLLSFASSYYCDGNTSDFYSCTRPSTYYFYPWWAVTFVVIGSFFIVLWFLRAKKHKK